MSMDYTGVWAIVVAAGSGTRMATDTPKQFALLGGQPMLLYSLSVLARTIPAGNIILAVPTGKEKETAALLAKYGSASDQIKIIAGGATRYHSVQAALALLPPSGTVLIHDAARPFLSSKLVRDLATAVPEHKAAVPTIEVEDSIRIMVGEDNKALDRASLRAVQTPQAFDIATLLQGYALPYQPSFTDDASVVEAAGYRIKLLEGEKINRKITTNADWQWALQVLKHEK